MGDSSGLALHYQAASFQIVFNFDKYMVTLLSVLSFTFSHCHSYQNFSSGTLSVIPPRYWAANLFNTWIRFIHQCFESWLWWGVQSEVVLVIMAQQIPFLWYQFLELFAIYAAISTWGTLLTNKQIIVFCELGCKNKHMKLLRALFFICASHNINLLTKHIPGHCNILADHLSCLQVEQFHLSHGSADNQPSIVPDMIWDIWGTN